MKRRAETLLRGAAVVLTLATIGWAAWWLHRGTDPVEYTNYEARLRVAVAANDVLDEEVVRAASGAAATFDGVDLAASELSDAVERLHSAPSFLGEDGRADVESVVESLRSGDLDDAKLRLKLQRVERFKSQTARLRAIQFDFTTAAGDLVEALRKPDPGLSQNVDQVMREILTYSLVDDVHIANRIDAEVNELSSYLEDPAVAKYRDALEVIVNDASFIDEAKPKLDGLTETTIADRSLDDAFADVRATIEDGYMRARSQDAQRAQILVGLLIASILAIAAAVIATVLRQREAIRAEHDRAEALLLNILPPKIAQELKDKPNDIIADSYPDVSVLFADIVGFTPLASKMSPVELVKFLNRVFSAFDRLAAKHGLEKIKTLGDAYMVASGLPEPRADHAEAMANMALDMQQEILAFRKEAGEGFGMRIGINSGPVVAGVIGIRKFIYDLWGDAVNVASRMESHGVPNAIHCSDSTFEHLKDKGYRFEPRGVISVKGKGEMKTWLLTGREESREPVRKAAAG